MADDILGKASAISKSLEIDAGFDAHFVTHEHQILGTDIAGCAAVTGKRASTESADRSVVTPHTHFETRMGIGDPHAACVVQMESKFHVGVALTHGAEHTLD